jgi:alkanesulfonate monooxygenase SsuD/methylene tetrahydromethanopterin reductase-like flavin-dependent oxidoreductase (luciferase family)
VKVFLFDLLPYAENLDHLKVDGRLPQPLGKRYFKPDVQARTYADHLTAWEAMERYGFDGIGFNEHHGTPYGTMTSPNLLAAAISQRTEKLKLLILGNLLPIHEPLRLAEEIALLDCLSNGRVICGVARGIPREYRYFDIPLNESRERFDECFEVMRRAWTEESFSHHGKHFHYEDIALWPRPMQEPHPPVWVPISGSKESIAWAARVDATITPSSWISLAAAGVEEEIVRYYAQCQAQHGRKVTPEKISIQLCPYVADSKAKAIEECGPHYAYLHNTLVGFDQPGFDKMASSGYASAGGALRPRPSGAPTGRPPVFGNVTKEMLEERADELPWGSPDEVAEHIIRQAKVTGAGTALLLCNPGAMPQEMFLNQIKRIGEEVLPRLHAYEPTSVPQAEELAG